MNWLNSIFGTPNASDEVDNGGTVFSYVLIGVLALLLIAIVFGELEELG